VKISACQVCVLKCAQSPTTTRKPKQFIRQNVYNVLSRSCKKFIYLSRELYEADVIAFTAKKPEKLSLLFSSGPSALPLFQIGSYIACIDFW